MSGDLIDWNPWGAEEPEEDPWKNEKPKVQEAISFKPLDVPDDVDWGDFAGSGPEPQLRNSRVSIEHPVPLRPNEGDVAARSIDPWDESERQSSTNHIQAIDSLRTQAPIWPQDGPFDHAQSHNSRSGVASQQDKASKISSDPWDHFEREFASQTLPLVSSITTPTAGLSKTTLGSGKALDPWDHFERQAMSTGGSPVVSAETPKATSDQHVWPFVPQRSVSSKNDKATSVESLSRKPRASPRPPRDENVLFDAEDVTDEEGDEVEDDFGDFEAAQPERPPTPPPKPVAQTVKPLPDPHQSLIDFDAELLPDTNPAGRPEPPPKPAPASTHALDLLGNLDDVQGEFGGMENPKQQHFKLDSQQAAPPPVVQGSTTQIVSSAERTRYTERALGQMTSRNESNVDSTFEEDTTGWEAWEEPVANEAPQAVGRPLELPPLLTQSISTSAPPPSNMPPPALLLTLFPPIFTIARIELFSQLNEAVVPIERRTEILSHPSTRDFLTSYLTIGTVLARIIAGRKLRWKRDTLLSQSMRIGQASSGKVSGMKLASIDKNENVREEREVANVVRAWKGQLGKLKASLTGAAIVQHIPDVAEGLPVRTAQPSEGAIAAPKPCILCALKRNERVPKVDFQVQDSFGEWWVEHWGHWHCRLFWDSHEQELRSK